MKNYCGTQTLVVTIGLLAYDSVEFSTNIVLFVRPSVHRFILLSI
jgi:hypothetical protein